MVQPISATYTFVFARKGISPKTGKGLLQLRIYLNRTKMKYVSTDANSGDIDHLIPVESDHLLSGSN